MRLAVGIEKLLVLLQYLCEEVLDQQRNVFLAVAQRRQRDVDHVQPVIQILAELAFFHQLAQVRIGRGQDAHVHLDGLGRAERRELLLLDHAQQLGLRLGADGADLVEEMVPRSATSK